MVFGDAAGDVFAYEGDRATICPCSQMVLDFAKSPQVDSLALQHIALPHPPPSRGNANALAGPGECLSSFWKETIYVHAILPIIYDRHFNVYFEVPAAYLPPMLTGWEQLSA